VLSRLFLALGLAALAAPLAARGETGYTTRELELRERPVSAAPLAGKVPKNAKVEILAEQKAWSQVKSGEVTGWTLSFYVMKGEPAAAPSMGRRLGGLFSLGTERRAETSATLGIRGLDEEDLAAAQYNEPELKRLESLGVPRAEGEAFAKRGALVPQKVDYLAPLSQ